MVVRAFLLNPETDGFDYVNDFGDTLRWLRFLRNLTGIGIPDSELVFPAIECLKRGKAEYDAEKEAELEMVRRHLKEYSCVEKFVQLCTN